MNGIVESATSTEDLLVAQQSSDAPEYTYKVDAAQDADRLSGGLWTSHMLCGDFEAAWQQSDAIRRRGAYDPNCFWQGESLAGKRVIVRCLHGFGDATQFLCYMPRLQAITSSLVLEVPPRFVTLAKCFSGVDEVITWGDQAPSVQPAWDVQLELMELPYIFRTQLSELPIATKYLNLPSPFQAESRHAGRLRIGLSWNVGTWNTSRSINLQAFRPLLELEGCEFWSLKGGPEFTPDDKPIFSPMHSDPSCRESIEGLASLISQLDLIVTVDTLAAHLAGALGVKAWVLLQHHADWRWMCDRSESPWYPSITLFRQPAHGGWEQVVAAVRGALLKDRNATMGTNP